MKSVQSLILLCFVVTGCSSGDKLADHRTTPKEACTKKMTVIWPGDFDLEQKFAVWNKLFDGASEYFNEEQPSLSHTVFPHPNEEYIEVAFDGSCSASDVYFNDLEDIFNEVFVKNGFSESNVSFE